MAGPFDSAADEIDSHGAIYDRKLARRLLRFLGPYKKEVALSVVLLAAIAALEITGPYLTKVAIDTYVKPVAGGGFLPAEASQGLLEIGIAYVAVVNVGGHEVSSRGSPRRQRPVEPRQRRARCWRRALT